jgi:uncharacterized cupredoxin-like copper-binding protein
MELLAQTLTQDEVAVHRDALATLAENGKRATSRHGAMSAMMIADGTANDLWSTCKGDSAKITDFLGGVALLPPGTARQSANVIASSLAIDPMNGASNDTDTPTSILGQFIRIELPTGEPLTLSEIEVFSDGRNVARDGVATQSSTGWSGVPELAIDGNNDPTYGSGTQSHTAEGQDSAWWEVDLGAPTAIDSIVIWGRQEGGYGKRMEGHAVRVLKADGTVVLERTDQPAPERRGEVVLRDNPYPAIQRAAIHALATGGTITDATSLSDVVTALVTAIPITAQDDPVLIDAKALADRIPSLATQLGPWIIPEVTLAAIPHMMAYDAESFTVEAGKPVRVTLRNPDTMPHNLVIGIPGSLETIGRQATMMGTTDYAMGLHFVPRIKEVLHWMKLVGPDDSETIMFVAPTTPGEYPVICTYPGHWATMNAVMIVTPPEA